MVCLLGTPYIAKTSNALATFVVSLSSGSQRLLTRQTWYYPRQYQRWP